MTPPRGEAWPDSSITPGEGAGWWFAADDGVPLWGGGGDGCGGSGGGVGIGCGGLRMGVMV